jgi:hypothetical protein
MTVGIMTAGRAVLRKSIMPAALLSFTGLMLLGAPAASIAATGSSMTLPVSGQIKSGYHSTICVENLDGSTALDNPIVLAPCNAGQSDQDWTLNSDGTIQVDGGCLDVYRYGTANKTKVEYWTCHGTVNQQWEIVTRPTLANPELMNPYSGKCLDDPRYDTATGTQLEIYTCNGGLNQQWVLPGGAVTTPMRDAARS